MWFEPSASFSERSARSENINLRLLFIQLITVAFSMRVEPGSFQEILKPGSFQIRGRKTVLSKICLPSTWPNWPVRLFLKLHLVNLGKLRCTFFKNVEQNGFTKDKHFKSGYNKTIKTLQLHMHRASMRVPSDQAPEGWMGDPVGVCLGLTSDPTVSLEVFS